MPTSLQSRCSRNLTQAIPEFGLLKVNDFAAMALGAAVLAHHPADEAFRSPVTLLQGHNGPAATFRAQKFPSARSYCFAKAFRA